MIGFRAWTGRGVAFALSLLLAACADEPAVVEPPPPAAAIEKRYEQGGAEVLVTLDRDRIDTTESLALRVEALVDEGASVEFPERAASPEDFLTLGSEATAPRLLEDGRVAVSQVYELEPLTPGELTLPPIEIEVTSGDNAEPLVVATEALPITVESVLEADDAELRDISGPRSLPAPWWWYAVGGALGLALFAFLYWRYARRKSTPIQPEAPPQPHEAALHALQRLLAGDDLAEGRYKRFYGSLSDILRRYIEDRFGLRAPERTTEEFLEELRAGDTFPPDQQQLLRGFLQHCDLVKFAELQPSADKIDETVELCRRFIEETKPQPPPESLAPAESASTASVE